MSVKELNPFIIGSTLYKIFNLCVDRLNSDYPSDLRGRVMMFITEFGSFLTNAQVQAYSDLIDDSFIIKAVIGPVQALPDTPLKGIIRIEIAKSGTDVKIVRAKPKKSGLQPMLVTPTHCLNNTINSLRMSLIKSSKPDSSVVKKLSFKSLEEVDVYSLAYEAAILFASIDEFLRLDVRNKMQAIEQSVTVPVASKEPVEESCKSEEELCKSDITLKSVITELVTALGSHDSDMRHQVSDLLQRIIRSGLIS